ncbi:MAG: hypothetical protein A2010_18645 [Nitrospirae bacterium GWD2_57_9]|nr:MAG: hypothetical protein A2010_18645 [Nitrospirae bacterium GWD2_57_9]OGW45481.1 MAG: hypothetical protein A2078_12595 [Nitrospirae bacterium GWC2_57_9]
MRKGIARFLEMRKRGKLVNGSIIKIFLEKGRSICYFKGRLFRRQIHTRQDLYQGVLLKWQDLVGNDGRGGKT